MHSWPPWWSWTLPQGFPALATSSRWFWPFKVCHFDLPGLRYEPETAEKYQKVDGSQSYEASKIGVPLFEAKVPSEVIWGVGSQFGPLRGQKRSKPKKVFFPLKADLAGLMMGTKTFKIWPFWPELLRFKVIVHFCHSGGDFGQVWAWWGDKIYILVCQLMGI